MDNTRNPFLSANFTDVLLSDAEAKSKGILRAVQVNYSDSPESLSKSYDLSKKYSVPLDAVQESKTDYVNKENFDELSYQIDEGYLLSPSGTSDLLNDPSKLAVIKDQLGKYNDLAHTSNLLNDSVSKTQKKNLADLVQENFYKEQYSFVLRKPNPSGGEITDTIDLAIKVPNLTGDVDFDRNYTIEKLYQESIPRSQDRKKIEQTASYLGKTLSEIPENLISQAYFSYSTFLNPKERESAKQQYLFEQKKANILKDIIKPQFDTEVAQDVFQGADSVIQSVPAVVSSIAGYALGGPIGFALQLVGPTMAGLEQTVQTSLRGGSPLESFGSGILSGGAEYFGEKVSIGFAVNALRKAFGKTGGDKALRETFAKYFFSEQAGEQATTLAQDAIDTAIANPDKTWGEYFSERGSRGYETMIATTLGTSVFGGSIYGATKLLQPSTKSIDVVDKAFLKNIIEKNPEYKAIDAVIKKDLEIKEAEESYQGLYQMVNTASDLKKRNPTILQEYINKVSESQNIKEVFIDNEQLTKAFESGKIIPDDLSKILPSFENQLQSAFQFGFDYAIPLSEFVTGLAGTDIGKEILPFVKLSEDGLTKFEAETSLQDQNKTLEELKSIVEGSVVKAAFNQDFEAVKESIKNQIIDTSVVSPKYANDYAELLATAFETIALDNNILTSQAYNNLGFDIKSFVDENNKVKSKYINDQQIKGEFVPDDIKRSKIILYKGSDLTTILHEFGHAYLHMLFKMAQSPNAPLKIKEDSKSVLEYFNVESMEAWNNLSFEEQRPLHEKFAETFESYLIKGKAPKPKLKKIFLNFMVFLKNAYSGIISPSERYALNPDIRRVFDNIFLSSMEIQKASKKMKLNPLFKSAESANLSPEDYQKYIEMFQENDIESAMELEKRQLATISLFQKRKDTIIKGLQEQNKKTIKALKDGIVFNLLKDDKEYKLFNFLKTGIYNNNELNVPRTINEQSLIKFLKDDFDDPADVLNKIKKNVKVTKGKGLDVVSMAEIFGYQSVNDLVATLISPADYNDFINKKIDELISASDGDAFSPKSLEKQAIDILHNDLTQKLIAQELQQLDKMAGRNQLNTNILKNYVDSTLLQTKIVNIKPYIYLQAEQKYAQKVFDSEDILERSDAKRKQFFNFLMYKKSIEINKEINLFLDYVKTLKRKIDKKELIGSHVQQINIILQRYNFLNKKTDFSEKSIVDFLDQKIKQGVIDAAFLNTIPNFVLYDTTSKSYKDLSLEEFLGVEKTLKQLEFLGIHEKEVFIKNKNMNFQEEKSAILNEIIENNQKKFDKSGQPLDQEKTSTAVTRFLSELQAVEDMILKMTGGKFGITATAIFKRISDANHKKNNIQTEFRNAVYPFLKKYNKTEIQNFTNKIYEIYLEDGRKIEYTRETAFVLAGVYGTQEGVNRVTQLLQYTEKDVSKIIDQILTKNDIDLLESFWKASENVIWEKLKNVNLATDGVSPPKAIHNPIQTQKYSLKGGYFPLVYTNESLEDIKQNIDFFESKNPIPFSTRKGSSKERLEQVSSKRKLDLSLNQYFLKIDNTIHDIAYREAGLDVQRFLRDPDIKNSIIGTIGFDDYINIYKVIGMEVSNQSNINMGSLSAPINFIRQRSAINLLSGFKTAFLNIFNIIPAMSRLPMIDVGRSIANFLNPINFYFDGFIIGHKMVDFAFDQSETVRAIYGDWEKTAWQEIQDISKKYNWVPDFSRFAFILMQATARVSVSIIFDASYQKRGIAETESILRQSVGTSRRLDKISMTAKNGFLDILSPFLTYVSRQLSTLTAQTQRQYNNNDFYGLAQTWFMIVIIPAVLQQWAMGDDDDNLGDYITAVLKYPLAGIPVLGTMGTAFLSWSTGSGEWYEQSPRYSGALTAFSDAFRGLVRSTSDVISGDADYKDVKAINKGLGFALNYPSAFVRDAFDIVKDFKDFIVGENK